jgi:RHS repeat-associated protein
VSWSYLLFYFAPITTTYTNDIIGLAQVLVSDNGLTATHMLFGQDLILQDDGTETRFLLADGLGSTRTEMVGSAVETTTTYEPYGKLLAQSGSSGTVYGYTGEAHDASTGLVFLRARYYSPDLKLFLSRDPFPGYATLSISQNGYAYAHANPVNLIDPSGAIAAPAGSGVLAICLANPIVCGAVVVGGVIIIGGIVYLANHPPPVNLPSGKETWQHIKDWCIATFQTLTDTRPRTDADGDTLARDLFGPNAQPAQQQPRPDQLIDVLPMPQPQQEPDGGHPPPPPPPNDGKREYLYHYTNVAGYNSIIMSNHLKGGNGIFGYGVYLTDISPLEASLHRKGDLAYHIFANSYDDRVTHWIRVEVSRVAIEKTFMIFNKDEDRYGGNPSDDNPYGTPYVGRSYSIYRGTQLSVLDPDLNMVVGGSTTFRDE